MRTESDVREAVTELNRRVAEHLRFPSGPRVPVGPVDVDTAVTAWRGDRGQAAAPPVDVPPGGSPTRPQGGPRRWWRRRPQD